MSLNQRQKAAIRCAVADLIGAVQVHRVCDPILILDENSVLSTLDELADAFPDVVESVEIPELK